MKHKLIRITTVPQSLQRLLEGQLRFMNQYYEVLGISSNGEVLNEVKIKEKIRVQPLEMTRIISPLKDLKALWQLYKLFKKEKPFIVQTHTPKAGTLGMTAAWLAGVPVRLHTVAGLPLLEANGNKRKLLDWVEKMTYACATRIYPNSKGLHDIIIKNRYTSNDKLRMIANGSSNGIDTEYFNPANFSFRESTQLKERLRIQPEDFVFIFVGRLVKDKGVNELVQAFIALQKEFNKVKLLVLGKFETELDPLSEYTQHQLKENSSIIYVGYQDDVRPYFAVSDVLVFPSYREGFPNVVMQAGAMGLPSIVSDINGCNEIILPEENGIIIPPKNTEALYSAMKRFLDEKPLSDQLGLHARDMIVSRYQQKLVWDALLKEYKSFEKLYAKKNI